MTGQVIRVLPGLFPLEAFSAIVLLILFSTLFLATIPWLQRRAERQKLTPVD